MKERARRKRQSVCTEALGVRSGLGTKRRQREKWYPQGASALLPLLLRMGAELTWAVDLLFAVGADRLPPAEAGIAHSKVPWGTARSRLAQVSSIQAWDGRLKSCLAMEVPASTERSRGEERRAWDLPAVLHMDEVRGRNRENTRPCWGWVEGHPYPRLPIQHLSPALNTL